ncbi:hypothetical protein [Bradyrhizobium sp. RDT46]|uniref:hypothetical protein n=1 Tax=Bradyrhizobium sp. RDT46 TaxID=3341829 RepID=UPI0035C7141A
MRFFIVADFVLEVVNQELDLGLYAHVEGVSDKTIEGTVDFENRQRDLVARTAATSGARSLGRTCPRADAHIGDLLEAQRRRRPKVCWSQQTRSIDPRAIRSVRPRRLELHHFSAAILPSALATPLSMARRSTSSKRATSSLSGVGR